MKNGMWELRYAMCELRCGICDVGLESRSGLLVLRIAPLKDRLPSLEEG
ncbi:MAG TPA: hypothetical protein VMW90_10325 [Acidobacteriota bacterium]|nr:hypothetical protein [Acidobacteriota bacterium]